MEATTTSASPQTVFNGVFYSAGVQTVLYMAATFADKELHFGGSELIIIILILQLVGLVGANFLLWFPAGKAISFHCW